MLFMITQLSLLFPSFVTLAFHNLTRWSLERDAETGSSLRVGGKGLRFNVLQRHYLIMLLFFRVVLHVSVFPTAAGLFDWLFSGETVVTHSCVNLNHLEVKSTKHDRL